MANVCGLGAVVCTECRKKSNGENAYREGIDEVHSLGEGANCGITSVRG